MLTPNDVHYLAALLTAASSPEAVQVEVGAMVYDAAAEKDRDVDVCVTFQNPNGITTRLIGIEVKAHTRPLDVTHVEQLCAKLTDMPSIGERTIVSASGFTQPARRKASKSNVSLLHLRTVSSLPGFAMGLAASAPQFTERTLGWATWPSVVPNASQPFEDGVLHDRIPVVGQDERPLEHFPDLLAIYRYAAEIALAHFYKIQEITVQPVRNSLPVQLRINISADNAALVVNGKTCPIHDLLVTGEIAWTERISRPTYRVLVRDNDEIMFVQCALGELTSGNLIGIAFTEGKARLINVAPFDRNKKKIIQHRIR